MLHRVQIAANVLLIDSDLDNSGVFCLTLLQNGFGVRAVSSRADALEVLQNYRFDYIVMDLFMPGMGPEDFIDDVNALSPQTEIVLITSSDDVVDRARALGIRHCFTRPYKMDHLLAALG